MFCQYSSPLRYGLGTCASLFLPRPPLGRLLVKHRLSDNVVPVKYFLGVLTRALRRARHFALVEGSAVPTKARS